MADHRGVTISAPLHERLHVDLRRQASALCRRTPR
ncbi:putative leader peptide [Actinomadura montaniterrae]|uniref:ADP-ribose pyrophosphatase n=1 Tax=Actinomadura montaniterrae TaxID=1803903 RepID=A0A6L3W604_9ACTN|nr:ADP-ribose pyrophosphatase [Actinomadura montaniterrae]